MSTIKDVARLASTSVATVSRYLNGETIRLQNAKRIDEAVAQLGYFPNHAAKTLKTSRSMMIGMVVSTLDSLFYSQIAGNAQMRLYESDYSLLTVACQNSTERVGSIMRFLLQKGAEGLIVACGRSLHDREALRSLYSRGIPVVVVDDIIAGCDCIISDGNAGAYEAAEHLIQNGHTRIAFVGGDNAVESARNRYGGFLRAMQDYGIAVDPRYIKIGDYTEQHGYESTRQLMSLDIPPTALFAASHDISVGSLDIIFRLGISIPDDISFIMYDQIIPIQILPIGITTVSQPIAQMGFKAAEIILKRLSNEHTSAYDSAHHYRLPTTLNRRDSVKDLRVCGAANSISIKDHKSGGVPLVGEGVDSL